MPLAVGEVLNNRYRIDDCLSQSEIGAVYKAWDMSLGLAVVIRENLDNSAEARRRFKVEANILTRLSHPNLPLYTDYFFINRQAHYLVQHFVQGERLSQKLQQLGPLSQAELLVWFTQTCNALAYLHHQHTPLIHGNINPNNIIIRDDGRAMLVGGGLTKIYDMERRVFHSSNILNEGYSALELYQHRLPDVTTDIYGVAATLYHLLTDTVPPNALDRSRDEATLVFPMQDQPIGLEMQEAIRKAMEPASERRYQDVNRFRADLEKAVEQASTYRDVLHVFPSNMGTYITGVMVLLLFACAILSVGSLVRDITFQIPRIALAVTPTPTATATPTPEPVAVQTPTPFVMQNFKSVAWGFSVDYPQRWRKREQSLQVRVSPTLRGLEFNEVADMAVWVGISADEKATPADMLTDILAELPRQAQLQAQRQLSIGGQNWRSIQIEFEQEGQKGIAVIASTRRDEVGYFMVVASPIEQWDMARPIFQQVISSFKFTKEAEVRFLSADELPPTPTPTPTPVIYIVQPGDSYGRIAALYGVNMETLAEENDLRLSDYLRVGQELIIPVGYD